MARDYAEKIRQAIAAYQEKHSLRNLIIGIVETFLAFLVLVVLIMLVNRGVRRLNRAILASDRIRAVKIGEFEFFTADRIKAVIISLVKAVRFLVILVLLYILLPSGFELFSRHPEICLETVCQPARGRRRHRRGHLGPDSRPGLSGGALFY